MNLEAIHAAAPVDLRVLARLLGLEAARGAGPDRARVSCPWHAERSPSCDLARRNGRVVAICRSCGAGGDVFALVGAVRGIDPRRDFRRVVRETAELFGVRLDDDLADRRVRPWHDPIVALAAAIDDAAGRWLAGRDLRPVAILEAASWRDILEALEVLATADTMRRAAA